MDLEREAWRRQVNEAPIDPGLAIIDAHHHLVPEPHRPRLERYVLNDIIADVNSCGHNIVATVHVDAFSNYRDDGPEALRAVGETEYVERLAQEAEYRDAPGLFDAIVANADMMLGRAVGDVLDAHRATSPRVKGVRHMTVYDPDLPPGIPGHRVAGMLMCSEFRDGLRELERRGMTFDAGIVQSQFGDLIHLADAVPGATIIIGHLGTPLGIGRYAQDRAAAFAEWRAGMTALAKCPNVFVKIGGMNMAFTGLGFDADAPRPPSSEELARLQQDHVRLTIDLFGPSRCMFESNFPVDKWYASYGVIWNSFKRMTQDFGQEDREALFHGTAARAYQIDLKNREDY